MSILAGHRFSQDIGKLLEHVFVVTSLPVDLPTIGALEKLLERNCRCGRQLIRHPGLFHRLQCAIALTAAAERLDVVPQVEAFDNLPQLLGGVAGMEPITVGDPSILQDSRLKWPD